MAQTSNSETQLKQAILAVQSGRLEEARRMLAGLLHQDPNNAVAWVWLGKAVDDVEKRRDCFSRALHIDPNNDEARRGMVALLSGPQAGEEAPSAERPSRISAYPSRCPSCGAHLRYEVSAGALRCQHCGTQQAIPQDAEKALWLGMPPDMSVVEAQSEPVGRETLRCRSCGATSELSARASSLACPFCGSPLVVRARGTTYLIPPRAIVPFLVDREEAQKSLRDWLARGFLRPADLAAGAEVVDIVGVYLPFWAFKGLAEVSYNLQTPGLAALPMIPVQQRRHIAVPDTLVPASYSLTEEQLRAIEPFDVAMAMPFRPEYLAGWPAEVYQVALADAAIRARERMSKDARNKAAALAPSTEDFSQDSLEMAAWGMARSRRQGYYRPEFCTVQIDSFLHLLLPVWLGAYRYRGRTYSFAVNGQSGQAGGEAPRSAAATALAVAWGVVGVAVLVGAFILIGPAIWNALFGQAQPVVGPPRTNLPLLIVVVTLLLFLVSTGAALWPQLRDWLRRR